MFAQRRSKTYACRSCPTAETTRSRGPKRTRHARAAHSGVANSAMAHMKAATAGALAASREASTKAAELQARARGAKSLSASPGLADETANRTKHATSSAVSASKTGIAKAAKIGRETVLPELGRTGAKVRERTRPERLAQDYRAFLLWLHDNVLDYAMERLFFVPTKSRVALEGLTVRGSNRARGHDYRPSPYFVFKWALVRDRRRSQPLKLRRLRRGQGTGAAARRAISLRRGRRHRVRRGAA